MRRAALCGPGVVRARDRINQHMKYAVIVDAGSSGSRAFVYTWPDAAAYAEGAAKDSSLLAALPPVASAKEWVVRVRPGVSSFAGHTRAIWKEHLQPLLKTAQQAVPQEQHHETPIYFLATAGLRLLAPGDQKAILQAVCGYLQDKTDFLVPECDTHVAMIDGETEGLYGWLGLNYLVHYAFAGGWDSFDNTYGFLDMGGASAQLAFAAEAGAYPQLEPSLHELRLRTVGGAPVHWHVFVNTWLGHGANQAHVRMRKQIVHELTSGNDHNDDDDDDDDEQAAIDPCLPRGAVDAQSIDGKAYAFHGSGDFDACEARTKHLLSETPCPEGAACLFEALLAPDVSLAGQRFVGVSEYWYTLQDLFATNGKFDYASLAPKVNALCSSDWETIQDRLHAGELLKGGDTPFNENEIMQACFKSAWVLTVLRRGLNFALSTQNPSLDHNFQDAFQSAIDIGGTEISWTLGRALLYASSQIRPLNTDTDLGVGYVDPHGAFVTGGETLNSHQIAHIQASRQYTHLGWSIGYTVATVLAIIIVLLRFRHSAALHKLRRLLSKAQRAFRARSDERSHRRTASSIGYGYSYPHAEVPLADLGATSSLEQLASHGRSSSHTPSRTPSRVGSRINIAQP